MNCAVALKQVLGHSLFCGPGGPGPSADKPPRPSDLDLVSLALHAASVSSYRPPKEETGFSPGSRLRHSGQDSSQEPGLILVFSDLVSMKCITS